MTEALPPPAAPLAGKPTSAARSTLSRIMTVLDTNLLGTVHGGVVMKLVDDVAGVVAQRHSGGAAVTASMDEMDFLEPVRVGDLVHAAAQVNWAGRTSMEVGVRVLAEPWNEAGVPPTRVATAYLVFVAVDAEGRPPRGPARAARDGRGPPPGRRGGDPAGAPAGPPGGDPAVAGDRHALRVGQLQTWSPAVRTPVSAAAGAATPHGLGPVVRRPDDDLHGATQPGHRAPAARPAARRPPS